MRGFGTSAGAREPYPHLARNSVYPGGIGMAVAEANASVQSARGHRHRPTGIQVFLSHHDDADRQHRAVGRGVADATVRGIWSHAGWMVVHRVHGTPVAALALSTALIAVPYLVWSLVAGRWSLFAGRWSLVAVRRRRQLLQLHSDHRHAVADPGVYRRWHGCARPSREERCPISPKEGCTYAHGVAHTALHCLLNIVN